ncbi:MAG: hypothetical protein N4A50_01395 [Vallitalea sp.]|jgi:hypothetical protein|nr:hypothetical protein [Vallitalea sp.]
MQKTLAESCNYKILDEYETVYLLFKNTGKIVIIGDFYGDPETAFISNNESYCVVGGCGLIIYYLKEPFYEFEYNNKCKQWKEVFRNLNDVWWIEDISERSDSKIVKFTVDSDDGIRDGIYEIDVFTLNIRRFGANHKGRGIK